MMKDLGWSGKVLMDVGRERSSLGTGIEARQIDNACEYLTFTQARELTGIRADGLMMIFVVAELRKRMAGWLACLGGEGTMLRWKTD